MIRERAVAVPAALLAFVLTLALSGCFPKVGAAPGPLASETMEIAKARWADETPQALEQGRQAFLSNCSKCHGYPDVVAFPEAKWPATAMRMAGKAKLSGPDAENLTHFVLALRAAATQPMPASRPAAGP
jgi:mono/diheme cytochrome c family protein